MTNIKTRDYRGVLGSILGTIFLKGDLLLFLKMPVFVVMKTPDSHRSQFFILSHQKCFDNRLNTFLKLLCLNFGKKILFSSIFGFLRKSCMFWDFQVSLDFYSIFPWRFGVYLMRKNFFHQTFISFYFTIMSYNYALGHKIKF